MTEDAPTDSRVSIIEWLDQDGVRYRIEAYPHGDGGGLLVYYRVGDATGRLAVEGSAVAARLPDWVWDDVGVHHD